MPYQKEAEAVLAMWREVERSLAQAEPGSSEAERLQTDAVLLRDEHQRLIREYRPTIGRSRQPGRSPKPVP
jgi:hypothetical protein